jgi:hypothetical protein
MCTLFEQKKSVCWKSVPMERCRRRWQKPSGGWRFCVNKDAVKELLLVYHL